MARINVVVIPTHNHTPYTPHGVAKEIPASLEREAIAEVIQSAVMEVWDNLRAKGYNIVDSPWLFTISFKSHP